jgi:beta-glucosidase
MDNFEWIFGFEPQLGLMSVDRTTFDRTRKPSADVYERIVRAGAVGS